MWFLIIAYLLCIYLNNTISHKNLNDLEHESMNTDEYDLTELYNTWIIDLTTVKITRIQDEILENFLIQINRYSYNNMHVWIKFQP